MPTDNPTADRDFLDPVFNYFQIHNQIEFKGKTDPFAIFHLQN